MTIVIRLIRDVITTNTITKSPMGLVRNEEKITEQDRIYCQNKQDELYKTLDQIAWWYNIFKREAEKYEGKTEIGRSTAGR